RARAWRRACARAACGSAGARAPTCARWRSRPRWRGPAARSRWAPSACRSRAGSWARRTWRTSWEPRPQPGRSGRRRRRSRAASRPSDLVVLTSDNPRTEDALRILADIEEGVGAAGMTGHVVEPDRRAAIALAIGRARPGDLVLVAGKGHEDYQIVGTVKRHL